jgi:muramoyltetrapeptide carboxypeptidase
LRAKITICSHPGTFMKRPEYLKKGDKIGICATARKVSPLEIQPAIELFLSWGLEPVLSPHLFKEDHQFSGTDGERTADLQLLMNDQTIKAIISARGGYGTLRIIDRLDFTSFKQHPKWIIGFSDVTVLHSHLHNLGFETLHSVMAFNVKNADAMATLKKALFGETIEYHMQLNALNRFGKATAQVIGGNLSLLYALQGSVSDIGTKGKILFLEDLDEYLYHIDRMMLSLKRSGKLNDLAGLVIGGMTEMRDNAVPFGKNAEEIIMDAVKEFDFPVCFNFPAGHVERNCALCLGRTAELYVDEKTARLSFA